LKRKKKEALVGIGIGIAIGTWSLLFSTLVSLVTLLHLSSQIIKKHGTFSFHHPK
jgi:hypothetical protein